jgi:hypothetical protein
MMAAGLGFKTFTTGEVLTAGDVNGYLMQGINVFTNATARDAAITAPAEGQFAFTKDNNSLWYYDGAAWVASGATGDIEGVTAGVGISGGGTSGTVTVTNSMATAIDAKGDLVPGTGADTFARLAVGANNTVLTADSSTATGLKWATPVSGSTFSGASVYKNTNQSIATATAVVATWQVEDFDVDGYWDSGAATRLTIPTGKSGKFVISGRLTYTHNATGMRAISLQKNGNSLGGPNVQTVTESGIGVGVTASWIDDAVATDYYELVYNQRSGSTLTSEPGGGIYYDVFSIAYLGA